MVPGYTGGIYLSSLCTPGILVGIHLPYYAPCTPLGIPTMLHCTAPLTSGSAARARCRLREPWAQTRRNPWVGREESFPASQGVREGMPVCAELLRLSGCNRMKDWITTGSSLLFYLRNRDAAQSGPFSSGHPIMWQRCASCCPSPIRSRTLMSERCSPTLRYPDGESSTPYGHARYSTPYGHAGYSTPYGTRVAWWVYTPLSMVPG